MPSGPPSVDHVYPVPNPNPVLVAFHAPDALDDVELRVYTAAMVCVWTDHSGPVQAGWTDLKLGSLPQNWGRGLGYIALTPFRNGIKGKRVLARIFLLN